MWFYLAALLGLIFLLRWYRERQVVSNLPEKYIFITGCDSGFGNQLARQLDARGLRVLAACFTAQGAENLTAATSKRLQTTLLDVTSTESVAKAAEWVKSHVGDKGLWGLVNNAGILIPVGPNDWLTKEDFKKVIDTNLLGVIDVTIQMLPLVRRAKGRIVNVASILGRITMFGGGYCPSKYGIQSFSDSLRIENVRFGVKVCIIEPGYFQTNMANDRIQCDNIRQLWERLPKETKQVYGATYLQKLIEKITKIQRHCNQDLSPVTSCMEHALTAVHPRTRYTAGWDAKLSYIPLSYMPARLTDQLLVWFFPKPEQCC